MQAVCCDVGWPRPRRAKRDRVGVRMDYFSGFAWAVPRAFSDAVALCRFEEGDTLYDTKAAYEKEWDEDKNNIKYFLQVHYPGRVTGAIAGNYGSQFRANWHSELRLDLYEDHQKVGLGQIHTTQGRLYELLWKGDLRVLDTSTDEPMVPLSIPDVTRKLEQTRLIAEKVAKGDPVFVMAVDQSSAVSRAKILSLTASLGKQLRNGMTTMAPVDSGLRDYKRIAPSVEIAYFTTPELRRDSLHDLVKKAVYVPSKNAKKDMFSIARHGLIF